jgi:plastocyanin
MSAQETEQVSVLPGATFGTRPDCRPMSGPRTLIAGILTALTAATVWMGGCSDPIASLTGLAEIEPTLIISDTASSVSVTASYVSASTQAQPSSALAASSAQTSTDVAYISLLPGTASAGLAATIHNQRTGSTVTVPVIGGGFDPVAVIAGGGDVLGINVQAADGATLLNDIRRVPGKRPPRVVRTNPPPKKRDVALNSSILIVFSEPIDSTTLTGTSVQILRDAAPVAGRLEFRDAAHLTAAFVPLAPLPHASDYQLIVTQDIRDLDGEPLESPVTVEFRTIELPASSHIGLVAFESTHRWPCTSIYLMNSDGSAVRSVTDGDVGCRARSPAWSPDGARIAFVSTVNNHGEIYVMNADGSALRKLMQTEGDKGLSPGGWSPDGTKLVFTLDREPGSGIYVVNADGSGLRMLRDGGFDAAWSPDGRKIAFTATTSQHDIWVMNADGSQARRLTSHEAYDRSPTWSPDGRRIAFSSDRQDDYQIYVMNSDGSGVTRLTSQPFGTHDPAWSPDDGKIAFTSYNSETGSHDIHLINSDGSGVTSLTSHHQGSEMGAAWSPVPAPLHPDLSLQKAPGNNGDGQSDTVLATLAQPFRVLVTQNGLPASGVRVFWNLLTWPEGASFSATTTMTDAAGIASTTLTLGRREYPMRVEASASGAAGSPVLFDAHATPGSLARIIVIMGDGQAGIANTRLENDYIIKTADAHWYYNHVPAVGLEWAVASGGGGIEPGSFSGCYDMTCYAGDHLASVRHVLGPDYGPQTVTVTASAAPGAPRAAFTSFAAGAVITVGVADEHYVCRDGFRPSQVIAPVGSPVVWMPSSECTQPGDVGYRAHDVTFEDGVVTTPAVWGLASRTFSAPGTYRYRCTLHGEVGSVTVR